MNGEVAMMRSSHNALAMPVQVLPARITSFRFSV